MTLTPAELQRMQIQTILSALEAVLATVRTVDGVYGKNVAKLQAEIDRLRDLVVLGGPAG